MGAGVGVGTLGVTPLFFGCLLSEHGEDFWYGYNKYVFEKMNLKNFVVDPFFRTRSSALVGRTVLSGGRQGYVSE